MGSHSYRASRVRTTVEEDTSRNSSSTSVVAESSSLRVGETPPRVAPRTLIGLQRAVGNQAALAVTRRVSAGASAHEGRLPLRVQRDVDHDVRRQWGYRIGGSITLRQGNQTTSHSINAETTEIRMGEASTGTLRLRMTPRWYQWGRLFRWSDPERNFTPFRKEYTATWNIRVEGGTPVVNFASDTNRVHEVDLAGLPNVKFFEMEPGASGAAATVKVIGFNRDGDRAETTLRFNVVAPEREGQVEIGPVAVQRTLVLRDFGVGSAELTSQHVGQLQEFWNGLGSATRRTIEQNGRIHDENVQIYGFTSSTDRVENNFWLSGERARMVSRALMLLSGNQNLDNMSVIARGEVDVTDVPGREVESGAHRAAVVRVWDIGDGH